MSREARPTRAATSGLGTALASARHAPLIAGLAFLSAPIALSAQAPDVLRERAEYLAWLTTAVNSPLKAVAQQPLGDGLRLGPPDADIPLPGMAEHRIVAAGGTLSLETPSGKLPLSRGRPVPLGRYSLFLTAAPTGTVVTVFGNGPQKQPPGYYAYDPSLVFRGRLLPPATSGRVRVLAADGIEVEATEAGTVIVPLGGRTRLRVLRIPTAGSEESALEIFFRDESNGRGTYPAGRFVELLSLAKGSYRLDLNRARNPFCAYSSVYPCPAPWRGNAIRAPVHAGERYTGGGLAAPPRDRAEQ